MPPQFDVKEWPRHSRLKHIAPKAWPFFLLEERKPQQLTSDQLQLGGRMRQTFVSTQAGKPRQAEADRTSIRRGIEISGWYLEKNRVVERDS